MRRTTPLARTTQLKRTGRMKAKRRPSEPGRAEAAGTFHAMVLRDPCLVCGSCGPREAHHAIAKQTLGRIAGTLGLQGTRFWAVVYDPMVGVALCANGEGCNAHARHTTRTETIPGHMLPRRVHDRARQLGPEAVAHLERHHPADPAP